MSESPQDKLGWYVDHQVRSQQAAGVEPDVKAITATTSTLLGTMDRAIADGEIKLAKRDRTAGEVVAEKNQAAAEAQATAIGAKFYTRDLPTVDAPRRQFYTGVDQERYVAMCRRLAQLCKRSSNRRLRYGRDSLDQADFEFPRFAVEIVNETMKCNMRRGIYAFLNTRDCRRVRDAEFIKICDRSTAVLGQWWIPK